MKNIINILLSLTLVTSLCSFQNKKTNKNNIVFKATFIQTDDNKILLYQCNEFVVKSIPKEINIKSLMKNKRDIYNIYKEPIKNIHDTTIIDTTYNFTNKQNWISIYKASHAEMVNHLETSDKRLIFYGDIKVGMTKETFKSKFKIKLLKDDNVIICDNDNIAQINFYFKKNVLVKIVYNVLID